MKKQVFNPFLPGREYIPDGEPHLFGGRVYVFGSHDKFNGKYFCLNDYVCWSAPENDLSDWRFEGVIYRKEQDPLLNDKDNVLFAPDVVQGRDGRWYLYYTLASNGIMSVAVCDVPAGKYQYLGAVRSEDGHIIGTREGDIFQFDPGLLYDEGKIWLYSGFSPRLGAGFDALMRGRKGEGAYCMELAEDMLTVKGEPVRIVPGIGFAKGSSFEAHPFFEASTMRKIEGKYYFGYSSIFGHELCYAVSDKPDGGFEYKGVLVSNGDVGLNGRKLSDADYYMGNNHGGLICIRDKWYIFYHRHTNRHSFSRQACAERIERNENGDFIQAELTSCGLNNEPLVGKGYYPAYIACNLTSSKGVCYSETADETHPYITQDGDDNLEGSAPYIKNLRTGSMAGFKYFDLTATKKISVRVCCIGQGKVTVSDGTDICAEIFFDGDGTFSASFKSDKAYSPLYFRFETEQPADFKGFTLSE